MMSLLIQKSFKARRLRPTNSLCVRVHASYKQIDAEISNENGYESKDAEQVKKTWSAHWLQFFSVQGERVYEESHQSPGFLWVP